MHQHYPDSRRPPQGATGVRSWTSWTLLCFLAIAGFFLFIEHRAHVFGALPYLLLLACPIIHFFHHRGHGGGTRHQGGDSSEKERGTS